MVCPGPGQQHHKATLVISEFSWWAGRVTNGQQIENITLMGKNEGNNRLVSLTLAYRKLTEKSFWETTSKHIQDKVTGSNHHGFAVGKPCLTDMIAFYDKMSSSVKDGKTMNVIYLDYSKAFNNVSQTVRWIMACDQQLEVQLCCILGWLPGPILYNIFINYLDAGTMCTLNK